MGTVVAVLKANAPSEHHEQREFVKWFRQTHSPVRIFAIPNGEGRSLSAAGRLKAEGVSRGVPDLFIPEWWTWIEMKRQKGGVISPDQKDWHAYLAAVGYKVLVCKGCEDTKAQLALVRSSLLVPQFDVQ